MLESNPDLAGLRAQEGGAKARSLQALAPNEPVFSISQTDLEKPNLFGTGGATVYGLSWTLGFPGKAIAQSRQLESTALSYRETSYQKEIELLTLLSNVYVQLSVVRSVSATLREELQRADDTVSLTQKRYAAAQAAQTDILNAKFYKTTVEHDLLEQEATRKTLIVAFRALLRRAGDVGTEPSAGDEWDDPTLDRNFPELRDLMMRNRPQIRALDYQKSAASLALTGAILTPFPDFQLTANMNDYHVPSAAPVSGMMRSYTVGVSVAIPIFLPFNELSGMRAARSDLAVADFAKESAINQLQGDLESMVMQFDSARLLSRNIRELVLPAAKANYLLSLKTFAAGKLDYLKLLDARRNWVQTQRDLLQKKFDLARLMNQITLQVGCDWRRKGVPHECI